MLQKNSTTITQNNEKPFDEVEFIMNYESGNCTRKELIDGFQHLINSGLAWKLQGHYGRLAHYLIDEGYCHE